MKDVEFERWLNLNYHRYSNLTDAVVSISKNLLTEAQIPFLTIVGRTKDIQGCLEKKRRKNYQNPTNQMTDISGIRIILYFDHDLNRVLDLISEAFRVDAANSLNKNELLSANEVGYRSVHYVCDLGAARSNLLEFRSIGNLKFEFQVRTVLQHAWAEIAHGRHYKFTSQLPQNLERKLFLLSGLLEMADAGFSDLANQLDEYVASVSKSAEEGNLDIALDSVSIEEFVVRWAAKSNIKLPEWSLKDGYQDLLQELNEYGIDNVRQLSEIIPQDYLNIMENNSYTIRGLVRDWMIISDVQKFATKVNVKWFLSEDDIRMYRKVLSSNEVNLLKEKIKTDTEEYYDQESVDEDFDEIDVNE